MNMLSIYIIEINTCDELAPCTVNLTYISDSDQNRDFCGWYVNREKNITFILALNFILKSQIYIIPREQGYVSQTQRAWDRKKKDNSKLSSAPTAKLVLKSHLGFSEKNTSDLLFDSLAFYFQNIKERFSVLFPCSLSLFIEGFIGREKKDNLTRKCSHNLYISGNEKKQGAALNSLKPD